MPFPNYKIDQVTCVASGDKVLLWAEYTGTWKGTFMGQKSTGKSFKVPQAEYYLFNEAGKITEHRNTPAISEVSKQIGLKM